MNTRAENLALQLNLGCGQNRREGFVNVDKCGEPDVRHDLEVFPWPWPDNAVRRVLMSHVLEHVGASPEVFIGVIKELYRVCTPGAVVLIRVPHPRHDDFLGDPTHVRVVTPQVLSLFSKANCRRWAETGAANTPLALYHDVDFEIREVKLIADPRYRTLAPAEVEVLARERNNVIKEICIALEVIK